MHGKVVPHFQAEAFYKSLVTGRPQKRQREQFKFCGQSPQPRRRRAKVRRAADPAPAGEDTKEADGDREDSSAAGDSSAGPAGDSSAGLAGDSSAGTSDSSAGPAGDSLAGTSDSSAGPAGDSSSSSYSSSSSSPEGGPPHPPADDAAPAEGAFPELVAGTEYWKGFKFTAIRNDDGLLSGWECTCYRDEHRAANGRRCTRTMKATAVNGDLDKVARKLKWWASCAYSLEFDTKAGHQGLPKFPVNMPLPSAADLDKWDPPAVV